MQKHDSLRLNPESGELRQHQDRNHLSILYEKVAKAKTQSHSPRNMIQVTQTHDYLLLS